MDQSQKHFIPRFFSTLMTGCLVSLISEDLLPASAEIRKYLLDCLAKQTRFLCGQGHAASMFAAS